MAASLRRRPRSPAAGPLEDDDLLSEILLRLPPQPSSLPRASAVCKRWQSLVSDARFSRRFRRHHRRNPPLLGFFHRHIHKGLSFVPTLAAPNRVPHRRFSFQRDECDCMEIRCLGCRHGLFLIHHLERQLVVVWDPVTGDEHHIVIPPRILTYVEKTPIINGAVFRVAGDVHFQVVLVMDEDHTRAVAWVYSSETGVWGDLISTLIPPGVNLSPYPTVVSHDAAVLVGDSLYWMLIGRFTGFLEFDLDSQTLAVIQVPFDVSEMDEFVITRTEAGGLGFLFLSKFSAQLWNRKTDCNGVASWALGRTIELDNILSLNKEMRPPRIVGFAECNNVVLLWTVSGIFMIQLQLLQFKKLQETNIIDYHPFEIVYAAGT